MKNLNIYACIIALGFIVSCASQKTVQQDDDFATEATTAPSTSDTTTADATNSQSESEFILEDTKPAESANAVTKDEFSEFDTSSNKNTEQGSSAGATAAAPTENSGKDEFAEFEKESSLVVKQEPNTSVDQSLENELNNLNTASAPAEKPKSDLLVESATAENAHATAPTAEAVPPVTPSSDVAQTPVVPAPQIVPEVVPQQTAPAEPEIAQIQAIQYQPNKNGGAVSILADRPLQFTTRINSATNQIIVEVANSVVPKKLIRSLNTKDMASSIGSVDIYQKPNSKVSRFVIQMRPGSSEPLVQPEGNSLLIVGASNPAFATKAKEVVEVNTLNVNSSDNSNKTAAEQVLITNPTSTNADAVAGSSASNMVNNSDNSISNSVNTGSPRNDINANMYADGILSSHSLEEFLISNNKFYGQKISIETDNLDIKEAIKFIAEESGANIIMDEGLEGKISFKLRQVPWDQALVLILKAKKLGYVRVGNVLRIGKISDIQSEEVAAIKLLEDRRNNDPLLVKRFFISYADLKEIETKIKEFIISTAAVAPGAKPAAAPAAAPAGATAAGASAATASTAAVSRGSVLTDARTSSLIVTDTPDNILKIEKLIKVLDTQPRQVFIETQLIEASEQFSRGIGVNWSSSGGTKNNRVSGSINQTKPSGGVLDGQFTWGQLDFFGDLSAQILLAENQQKIRVLQSQRTTVLSGQVATTKATSNLNVPITTTTSGTAGAVNATTYMAVPYGLEVNVTPQVSNENTITLDIAVNKTTVDNESNGSTSTNNAKGKVIVVNGKTAVVSGAFESTSNSETGGVPGLKDVPILGGLFKGKSELNKKRETMIFVTPHVLDLVVGDQQRVTPVVE